MKKFLEKTLMAADEVSKYVLLPMVTAGVFSHMLKVRVFGLSVGWSAYTISFVGLVVGLVLYDQYLQAKAASEVMAEKERLKARSDELLAEGRRLIALEEAQLWWSEHGAEVDSWHDTITGLVAGKEAADVWPF